MLHHAAMPWRSPLKHLCFAFVLMASAPPLALADLLPPPQSFDGSCLCVVSCQKAYLSPDKADHTTANAFYSIAYKTTQPEEKAAKSHEAADAACAASSLVPRTLKSSRVQISIKDAATRLCRNGAPEAGACVSTGDCANVSCVAAAHYRRRLP